MKVIDYTATQAKKSGGLSQLLEKLNISGGKKAPDGQELLINALRRLLDNNYTMLCNVSVEGLDVPVPQILIGPSGARVIYISDNKGVYRATEENWEELDSRSQDFKAAKPNLVKLAIMLAKTVSGHLAKKGLELEEIEPVLFFSNPGVHVDSSRPAARIVLSDALERFCVSLAQTPPVLTPQGVMQVVNVFGGSVSIEEPSGDVTEMRDEFSFKEGETSSRSLAEDSAKMAKKLNFSRNQWIILAALLGAVILFLIILVVLVIVT